MKKKSKNPYFPILIDSNNFNVIVIGAGNIATRKVLNLIEFDIFVSVLALKFSGELLDLSKENKISLIKKSYEYGDLAGFNLVFCATGDSKTDEAVFLECKEKGILLNVADIPELCNFIMPATIKRGDLTLSISSQGKAPFYVSETRKKLENIFKPVTSEIVELAEYLRKKMFEENIYHDELIRNQIINAFFAMDFEKIIENQGKQAAIIEIENIFKIITK